VLLSKLIKLCAAIAIGSSSVAVVTLMGPDVALAKQPIRKSLKIDRAIVPGQRVGQIVKSTTRKDLAQLFGAKNLKDTNTADPGGAELFPATLIKGTQGYTLLVQWQDRSRRRVTRVRILDPQWQTPEGLRLGTSFTQLRQIVGNFQLYGLDWDYSGTIIWNATKLSKYDRKLWVQITPDTDLARKQKKVRQSVIGDRQYPSNHPAWAKLKPTVAAILVSLD
jgi:hypothetical protein